MIYNTVRVALILISVVIVAYLSKSNKVKQGYKRLMLVLLIALNMVVNIYPVENLFVTFKSTDALLTYKENGKAEYI